MVRRTFGAKDCISIIQFLFLFLLIIIIIDDANSTSFILAYCDRQMRYLLKFLLGLLRPPTQLLGIN